MWSVIGSGGSKDNKNSIKIDRSNFDSPKGHLDLKFTFPFERQTIKMNKLETGIGWKTPEAYSFPTWHVRPLLFC